MKGLFVFVVLFVAGVFVFGYYQGWFNLASESADNKVHIQLTVDKDKIQADKQKALDKVHGLGHEVKDQSTTATEKK